MPTSVNARRLLAAAGSLLLSTIAALVFVTGVAGTAHAADGFRYWNYFHLKGDAWAFSQVGAGQYQPKDGAVEGYRFGTSTTADGLPPRADLSQVNFDTVCDGTEAAAGQKRVAVVIDYGTAADADDSTPPDPRADCAVVDANATGQQVLTAVADVRADNGLTCALDGYPARGCGDPVANAKEPKNEQAVAFALPNATSDTSGSAGNDTSGNGATDATDAGSTDEGSDLVLPLVGIGVLVVVIAGAALALNRRNKTA